MGQISVKLRKMVNYLNMLQTILLQSDWWIHFLASLLLGLIFYLIEVRYLRRQFKTKQVFWQLLLANLIDLDHFFSVPIYDSGRCSINHHALHHWLAFPVYLLGLLTRYRYFFASVILHLVIDYFSCSF